jgi:[ribosomal protein S18]-alanine N-acetyltransferase
MSTPLSTPALRIARPQDIDAIISIENRVFSDPWSPEAFTSDFTDPYTWFRVLEVDGVIAGYIIARIVARQGEIANIAVDVGHQGAGYGARLLDAAIAATDAALCEAIWLEVRISNEPAQRLYASRGFEPIGRRKGYYRAPVEDALVLRRSTPGAEKR